MKVAPTSAIATQQCKIVTTTNSFSPPRSLSVRLLVPCTRTWTAKFLGLAPSVVCNEKCAVVGDEGLLKLVLAVLVDVLLVVGDLREMNQSMAS